MWETRDRGDTDLPEGTQEKAKDLGIAEWVRQKLGFEPDETQQRLLESSSKRVVLNCARQWGKSTTTAAKAVHHAFTEAESLTLVVSPSARQSGEFVKKAEEFARRLGVPVKGDGANEMSLQFPNRARLVGLPGSGDTIRGFSSVTLLLVDEASRVSDELYTAVRPMLAVSGGTTWLLSTPYGKRGFFWEAWERGGPEWERARVPATKCTRYEAGFLEKERMTMGERAFRQEYMCEFEDAVSGVFGRDLMTNAIRADVKPLRIR